MLQKALKRAIAFSTDGSLLTLLDKEGNLSLTLALALLIRVIIIAVGLLIIYSGSEALGLPTSQLVGDFFNLLNPLG